MYENVIKDVEQSPKGTHIGAFFDFDGTIIYGYSATTYLREQIKRGDVGVKEMIQLVKTMTDFGLGNMAFSAMMSLTSQFLKGVEETEYVKLGERLYDKHIAKLIYPESRALIEAHLKRGHTVAIISAATPYQLTEAAKDLGIKHVKCTRLEIEDGRFTGDVIRPTCYGMGKVAAAQELVDEFDLDVSESFFYSDSDEDLQLLEYVGKPRPLNPNARLRRTASGRGWPVQDFSSRGRVGLRDYVRTIAVQGSMLGSFLAALPFYAITGSLNKSRNFSTSLFADVACAIAGVELDVEGEEHLWAHRPCVFVFNHQSQADMLVIAALLRRDLAGVGKKELADIPILGKVIQWSGTVLIDRANAASAIEAMQPLVEVMQNEGRSVCIAPEGTRSTSTNLGPFKKGAFHLAMQAGVPMVPIVIHNAVDVAQRAEFIMRPATVKVTVLPAVDTSKWKPETVAEHVEEVRDHFLIALDQMYLQQSDEVPAGAANKSALRKITRRRKSRRPTAKVSAREVNADITPIKKKRRVAKKKPAPASTKRPAAQKKNVARKSTRKKAVVKKVSARKSSTG
ncbi:MAG: HAD-IB family hydrolase [Gammaproteobacteria bacterium]|nr:HAD-IB family hydrolase [Gammaproteobacteria bacterium]